MSDTTVSINNIKNDLDSISGLTGIVSELIRIKEKEIHALVEYIKEYHGNACVFDYYGNHNEDV